MVWLHGGGYTSGANVQYPGHFLASKDVIVVVINYRVGAHGFMSTGDDAARGNYGLKDQIFALKYVRDNIANFGGDPQRVTLFGQSAGGSSASLLMMSSEAKGLFQQAILESGTDQAAWAVNEPAQEPHEYTKQVAEKVSCQTDNSEEMMDCLREVDTNLLYENGFDCKPGYFCQGFAPVVDGPGGVLPDDPWKLRARGEFEDMTIMNGQTSDDGSLFTVFLIPESLDGGFNGSQFEDILRNRLMAMFTSPFPDREEEVFNALKWYYRFWPHTEDVELNREAFNVLITDFAYGIASELTMTSQAAASVVFSYVLGYRSKMADAIFPPWMGVPHMGEIPYVFAWPWLQLNPNIRFDSGILIDIIDWDEKDIAWADFLMTLWTNFAKYGNPTPEPVAAPGSEEEVKWPRFDTTDYKYMSFYDDQIEEASAYRQKSFAFWLDYAWNLAELPPIGSSSKPKQPKTGIDVKELQTRMNRFYESIMKKAINKKK